MTENQIYIKAWYGDWTAASAEAARKFCMRLIDRMTCSDAEKKRLIEKNHLKGTTLEELLGSEMRR